MPANVIGGRGRSSARQQSVTACLRSSRSRNSSKRRRAGTSSTPARAGGFLRGWRDVFQVTAADDSALIDAIDAVERHRLSFWDAMLWAAARRAGCSAILSEDMQHGQRLGGVVFLNPFAADAATRLAPLLDA